MSNGCELAWLPTWIKLFEASCNKHDDGYENGGDDTRRFECDWTFLQAMRCDVKRLKWYYRVRASHTGSNSRKAAPYSRLNIMR